MDGALGVTERPEDAGEGGICSGVLNALDRVELTSSSERSSVTKLLGVPPGSIGMGLWMTLVSIIGLSLRDSGDDDCGVVVATNGGELLRLGGGEKAGWRISSHCIAGLGVLCRVAGTS
ncbi:MAG: hypothetical protein SP1CHLAM54_01000 [Chlamydiia bacterium]|nr:hypothetical protein [Chlamydiia bacterium]MCH9615022.1 hypothetical protein [Chlamydiia bacterium]MCH9629927.1 hypothetical protein [Chlamydiia bacterium]